MVAVMNSSLEKQINDHVTELFSPGWTSSIDKPHVYFSNKAKILKVQFEKDKFIYQLRIQGKTLSFEFMIIFYIYLDKSSLFVHTNSRFIKITDDFCKKTMNLLVPATNGVRKQLK